MNRRQRKKKKAQVFTIILGCTALCKAEQYEKMRKSVEYQLRTGSVVMLPAYLHVEAIIKQRGGRNIEIKQENGVVNAVEEIAQAAVDVAVFVTICTAKAVLIITAPVWILPYAIWRKGRKQ